jgi:membrane fusion protein, multidrug efflux system
MKKHLVALGFGAVICAGGLAAWRVQGSSSAPMAPAPPPPVPVVATKVQTSDFPIVLTGIGSAVAYNVVDVRAQVTGTIEKIGFVQGQFVRPGDLIAAAVQEKAMASYGVAAPTTMLGA